MNVDEIIRKNKLLEEENDKFVSSKMRLVKELPTKNIVVEFACACARRILKNYEKQFDRR